MHENFLGETSKSSKNNYVKYLLHLVAIAAISFGWFNHLQNKAMVTEAKSLAAEITSRNLLSDDLPELQKQAQGTRVDVLKKLAAKIGSKQTDSDETSTIAEALAESIDNSSTFMGIFMAFLSAGYGGLVFVMYLLPMLAHRATHSVFDSGEMVEKDAMAEARSKAAQGDYEAAILSYRAAAEKDPENRMPWVEIVKIQRDILEQPQAAIDSIREALEKHVWPENDAAYFLFRLVELYQNDNQDQETAAAILRQIIEQFPETRHSANARNKLQEWGMA